MLLPPGQHMHFVLPAHDHRGHLGRPCRRGHLAHVPAACCGCPWRPAGRLLLRSHTAAFCSQKGKARGRATGGQYRGAAELNQQVTHTACCSLAACPHYLLHSPPELQLQVFPQRIGRLLHGRLRRDGQFLHLSWDGPVLAPPSLRLPSLSVLLLQLLLVLLRLALVLFHCCRRVVLLRLALVLLHRCRRLVLLRLRLTLLLCSHVLLGLPRNQKLLREWVWVSMLAGPAARYAERAMLGCRQRRAQEGQRLAWLTGLWF